MGSDFPAPAVRIGTAVWRDSTWTGMGAVAAILACSLLPSGRQKEQEVLGQNPELQGMVRIGALEQGSLYTRANTIANVFFFFCGHFFQNL
jgi:hypothetical protein